MSMILEGRSLGARPDRPAPSRSRRRDAGTGEAENAGVVLLHGANHATLDWLAGSL